jgi:predicted ArsR family transcriptional regulator
MSFIFGKKGKGIPQNATFRLTETGREKLQQFTGDAKSQILVSLETNGTSDVDELAHAAGMSKGQVERLLPQLVKGGYVQYVSASGGEE